VGGDGTRGARRGRGLVVRRRWWWGVVGLGLGLGVMCGLELGRRPPGARGGRWGGGDGDGGGRAVFRFASVERMEARVAARRARRGECADILGGCWVGVLVEQIFLLWRFSVFSAGGVGRVRVLVRGWWGLMWLRLVYVCFCRLSYCTTKGLLL